MTDQEKKSLADSYYAIYSGNATWKPDLLLIQCPECGSSYTITEDAVGDICLCLIKRFSKFANV